MVVVADTTPINYLVLNGRAYVLRGMYRRVLIPQSVLTELQSGDTPEAVRKWIAESRGRLEGRQVMPTLDAALSKLGSGESEAIALAKELMPTRSSWMKGTDAKKRFGATCESSERCAY